MAGQVEVEEEVVANLLQEGQALAVLALVEIENDLEQISSNL